MTDIKGITALTLQFDGTLVNLSRNQTEGTLSTATSTLPRKEKTDVLANQFKSLSFILQLQLFREAPQV